MKNGGHIYIKTALDNCKISHEKNSEKAISRAQITWQSDEDPSRSLTQSPNIEIADMKLAIAGARQI